jgi:hypothetical protein
MRAFRHAFGRGFAPSQKFPPFPEGELGPPILLFTSHAGIERVLRCEGIPSFAEKLRERTPSVLKIPDMKI